MKWKLTPFLVKEKINFENSPLVCTNCGCAQVTSKSTWKVTEIRVDVDEPSLLGVKMQSRHTLRKKYL